jgi:uncharacterized protein (UPF0147 family)
MAEDDALTGIVESLKELQEDNTVPRNIKSKIQGIVDILNDETEKSIKVNKALSELDEIGDDVNLQQYTRTQIWNIVSMLETI